MRTTGESAADRAIRTALSIDPHSIEIEPIAKALRAAVLRDDQECLARFAFWSAAGYEKTMADIEK